MPINAGSSFHSCLSFFLYIEFAAAIEFFSAFQIVVEGRNTGCLPVSAHSKIFFFLRVELYDRR